MHLVAERNKMPKTVAVNGDRLLKLMFKQNHTLKSLAEAAGIGKSTISNMLKGKGPGPWEASEGTLFKLANALDVSQDYLIVEESEFPCKSFEIRMFRQTHLDRNNQHFFSGQYTLEIPTLRAEVASFEVKQTAGYVTGEILIGRKRVLINGQTLRGAAVAGTFETTGRVFLGTYMAVLRGRTIQGSFNVIRGGKCYTNSFSCRRLANGCSISKETTDRFG